MFDIARIDTYQKVTAADFNKVGQLARSSMAAQTRQMLVAGFKFSEFVLTFANGSFVVNVSDGFLIKEGQQYKTLASTPLNLIANVPPSEGLKRIVSVVGFAIPAKDDAPEQREFAVKVSDATSTTPAVYRDQSGQKNTLNRQIAQVAFRAGDLAPQPNPPQLTPDLCEIARVTLTQGGIESIAMVEINRAPNLEAISGRVDDLGDFVDGQGKRIDTIDKNLAALSARIPQPFPAALLQQFTRNLAQVNETLKLKTGDLSYNVDYGLDDRYSDNTFNGYAAAIEDGIRFPWVASKEAPLTLYTPNDPVAKVIANLLLPDFVEEARLDVQGKDGSLSIANQTNATITATKREIPRSSVRHGQPFTVCSNQLQWSDVRYSAAGTILRRSGETFQVVNLRSDYPGHYYARIQKVWTDRWVETRWDYVTTQIGLNGAIRGQTFRVPDFGFITSIDLPFTTADTAWGVTLLLCETSNGAPNLNRVLERCDLPANAIRADANGNVRTKFSFRPAFVDPGQLYSWVTVTRGNYALATVSGNKFAEGTSFITTDAGAFFQGDPVIDFPMTVNFARFKSPRVEVRFNDVDNVNGDVISALKFLYGSVVPAGTKIVHMARRSGGDWLPIGELSTEQLDATVVGEGPFGTTPLPASVQQKLVFIGTTTLMPAIDLSQAWVTALKLGNVRDHFTPVINFGTSCNRAEVEVVVDGPFDPANHTTSCKLIVAGVAVSPVSTTFVDDPLKAGRRTYTYGFSFTAVTSARVELPGTLASILSTYHVERRFVRAWLA